MNCPKCGSLNDDSAKFCGECGAKLVIDNMFSQVAETQSNKHQVSNQSFLIQDLQPKEIIEVESTTKSDGDTSQQSHSILLKLAAILLPIIAVISAFKKFPFLILIVAVVAVIIIIVKFKGNSQKLGLSIVAVVLIALILLAISSSGTTSADPITINEASEIFDTWSSEHLAYWPAYELVDEHDTSRSYAGSYLYNLWIADWELQLYIDKDTGKMFIDNGTEILPIDKWYESYYDESIYEDEYTEYYPTIDNDLVGRWRSFDGGALEFDAYGNITSCDFTCWSVTDYTHSSPDYLTYEASNGRVSCTAHFKYSRTYEIEFSGEYEHLRFNGVGDWWKRKDGTPGGGIVGKWANEGWEVFTCQFNADGTGWWNDKYPITWNIGEGSNSHVLEYTIYDNTYFDYQVNGNILTVFLSDGSNTYVKIGS